MPKHTIKICCGSTCGTRKLPDGRYVADALYHKAKDHYKDQPDVQIGTCMCLDNCERGNNILIDDKVVNFVTVKGLDAFLQKNIDRTEDLAQSGLTADDLENILFGTH